MVTEQVIHEIFKHAEDKGQWFEYECRYREIDCVRNTAMGYCQLLTQYEADQFAKADPNTFYEVVNADDGDFSKHYAYYYDETADEYFAVRKPKGKT